MAEQFTMTTRCPDCGCVAPAGTLVCAKCHTILAKPQRFVRRTPRWFIVLLILVIVALAAYAGYLAWDQLVQHNYDANGWLHGDTVHR